MKIAAALLLLLAGTASDDPPNVVVILADDLGYGDLGCYGNQRFATPHVDQLAAEGVRFTNFYVPVPYCAPARAALLTGRYPPRCGMTQNPFPKEDPQVKNGDELGLPLEEKTLGDLFRGAGYATAHIGKWHLGHQPRFRPLRRGFDEYYGILYSNDMHPVELFDGDAKIEYPVVQATLTRRLTERSIAFIEKNKDRRFFLHLAQAMPHKPLAASEQFYGKSGGGLYGDAVAEMDWSIGQVLGAIRRLGLDRRTLVLFTSDNGPWYGGNSGGLRGMKGVSWDGGIKVPAIVRWTGVHPAGTTRAEPAIIMDFFATALAAARIAPPEGRTIDGRDLAGPPAEALFSTRATDVATVRSGKWKLHRLSPGRAREKAMSPDEKWTDPRRPDGVRILAPYEQAHPSQYPGLLAGVPAKAGLLFDLDADPGEQKDLAAENPEVVARLTKLADAFLESLGKKE